MKIGVVMMLVELSNLNRAYHWSEIRDLAQIIDAGSFDSLWVYDHLLYRSKRGKTTGIWEGWSMLSALAAVTQRVELGTLVACNSFRNPAILAKMAHTVDEISGGRLILGLGAGWNEPEYEAFGLPFDHRVSRMEEALQIIQPLLKSGQVDFSGQYYTARNCEISPRSPRPDGIPLMVGTASPRMMRLTAHYADIWNTCYTTIPRSVQTRRKAFMKACSDEGREVSSIQFSYTASLAFPQWLDWKTEKKRGYLSGTPTELAEALHEYAALGTDHIMFHITPFRVETIQALAEAIALYRNESNQLDRLPVSSSEK